MKFESVFSRSSAAGLLAQRERGLTLVEVMVALAVGLFIALAVGVITVNMGRQFRITGSTTVADVNALVALSLINNAGRSAGAGLYNNGKPLCSRINAWRNGAVVYNNDVFLPVSIVDGGSAGASDTVVFTQGQGVGTLSSLPVVVDMVDANGSIVVSGGGAIDNGDYALVGAPGNAAPCTLFQVTAAPATAPSCDGNASSCLTLQRTGAAAGVNPVSTTTAFGANAQRYGFNITGVAGPAVVTRLGRDFRQTAFSVLCNSLVTYNDFTDTPACTSETAFSGGANALVSDVVLLQAQYGISANASSDVVTGWVDASGTWTNPGTGDAARIRAVRLVMVTRAKEADVEQVSDPCTNGGAVVNTGPCGFDDASAPVINVSAIPVIAGKTWRNYRYRTYQAVIPLRSVIWSR
jgi:type IV pilus assembly protein PilW